MVLALVGCKIHRISINENTHRVGSSVEGGSGSYSCFSFEAVVASNAGASMKSPEPVTHRQTANKTNQIVDSGFRSAHGVGN